ncbi:MAG: hypothetical protein QXU40_01285 [Candidatus Pacearchaeota archaeon]
MEELNFHKANSNKLIILLHGLMGSKDAPYRVRFAEKMNSLGYNVLRFNFSKGSGKNIYHSDIFTSQLNELEEICSSYSDFDIGLMGACTGGNVALVYSSRNKVKCVFTLAPFSIPLDYQPQEEIRMNYIDPQYISEIYKTQAESINKITSEKKRGRIIKKIGLFLPPAAVEDFLKYDICKAVEQIPYETKVCFVVGDKDPLVSVILTLPLYYAKKGLKELHKIPSRSHGYINPSEADKVNELAQSFFLSNL